MIKNLTIGTYLVLLSHILVAQYQTPGTGVSWDLDELVENAGGAILYMGYYEVLQDITISSNDTLRHSINGLVKMHSSVLFTVEGVLQLLPPDSILFEPFDEGQFFKGFEFDNSSASYLKNCILKNAGGTNLISSDMSFENCSFRYNDKSNSTGVIDLYHSSPQIIQCKFYENEGPAVLSAANGQSSPYIYGNSIIRNNTANTNMPQLNLGTSAPEIPIRIIKNTIEGFYDKAGGIAITTLAGGSLECVIDSNIIFNNRYGITAYGFDITSTISNNIIRDNNIENLPMQGGSGINYWGGTSNVSMVYGNRIHGNLWGITNTGDAMPNLGQVGTDTINPGRNKFYENGNGGSEYAFYNNTPNAIFAENNYWGYSDPDSVEAVIFHYPDDESLGLVDYNPYLDSLLTRSQVNRISKFNVLAYPNPAENFIYLELPDFRYLKEEARLNLITNSGEKVLSLAVPTRNKLMKINFSGLSKGLYILEINTGNQLLRSKVIIQ
ncbi:MAG: T9SS type A sorting domain-containing protein [Bacteroidales bacterium]|nr:T9SS type A sorting domain-containing protein [Bacteroidales bacterium]MCF8405420.1 T9SS type A sorting domain-containing protein [Bacteroidales bacterium]